MNTEQLITEACSLPVEQRAQVLERLLQSLSASNAVIDQAWLSLAQRRHDELISGKLDPVTPARLTSMKPLAKSVRFDDSMIWVNLADGRQLGVPLTFFPRLLQAQPEERAAVIISGDGLGLHWDELDEDISVPALLAGQGDMTASRKLAA